MKDQHKRRSFIKVTSMAGIGLMTNMTPLFSKQTVSKTTKVGIIGLDTSHSIAFTKVFNDPGAESDFANFKVVAAYPHGSVDIESSTSRIPKYTQQIQEFGVEIVKSIKALLKKVDVVLLETNDGRPHLEQAIQVFKAGKPVFIDKPLAASLSDVIAIFEASKKFDVPVFSSSSLRYFKRAIEIRNEEVIGKITGADVYSPAKLEKNHPDLFWYGIHAVEMLYTVMGQGCKKVTRTHETNTDVVVGTWHDGRIGVVRGIRAGKAGYGGTVFGQDGIFVIEESGYRPLLSEIATFFKTGIAPVSIEETTEIYAFMEAADESKRRGGIAISLDEVMEKARKKAR